MTKRQADSILQNISRVLSEHYDISKVSFGNEFLFNPDNNSITIPLTLDYRDKWFKEFVEERFEYKVEDIYLLLLLHEIGHRMTFEEISEGLNDFCNQDKVRIMFEVFSCSCEEETKPLNIQYWYLPDEFTATLWAVEFAKQNPDEVDRLRRLINKLLRKYIKEEN